MYAFIIYKLPGVSFIAVGLGSHSRKMRGSNRSK